MAKIYKRIFEYKYRGMEVDDDLNPEWLDQLNHIRFIDVVSTCSGHEDGVGQNLGGNKFPGFNFSIMGYEGKRFNDIKDKIYDLLEDLKKHRNTSVGMSVWMPKNIGWVMYNEDGPRKDIFSPEQFEKYNNAKIDRLSYKIKSTIPFSEKNKDKIELWWKSILKHVDRVIK